jgi:hypothetical protein
VIVPQTGLRVWLANGHTEMRRGMNDLALQVQQALQRDPHAGDLYVFRGRHGELVKILWHDGLDVDTRQPETPAKFAKSTACRVARRRDPLPINNNAQDSAPILQSTHECGQQRSQNHRVLRKNGFRLEALKIAVSRRPKQQSTRCGATNDARSGPMQGHPLTQACEYP